MTKSFARVCNRFKRKKERKEAKERKKENSIIII
nr:MAG TPA: hypothetical protein [Caudoviricetes sp.]